MKAIQIEVTPQLIEKVASIIQGDWGVSEFLAGFIAQDVVEHLVVRSTSERGAGAQDIESSSAQWRIDRAGTSRTGLPMLLAEILANQRDSA